MPVSWSADAIDALTPALQSDPWGGLASPVQVLHGSDLLQVCIDDSPAGLVAVRTTDLKAGREVHVIAAARIAPGAHAIAGAWPVIEAMARDRGAAVVTAVTAQASVQRSMTRAGWVTSGVVMIRRLQQH